MRKFDQAIFNLIIENIEGGLGVRKAVRQAGRIAVQTFYDWIDSDSKLKERYARATEIRHDHLFEEILEISDDGRRDYTVDDEGRKVVDYEHIQRARLRVDSRKWMLAKMNHRKYGDKIQQEVTGANGEPVQLAVTQRVKSLSQSDLDEIEQKLLKGGSDS